MKKFCIINIFLVIQATRTFSISMPDLIKVIRSESALFRQGSRYDEGDVTDTPIKKILGHDYDFIVIGAGTSGSVVANCLSENPAWRVLLLEAGRDETFPNDIPLFTNSLQSTGYNWGYALEPQDSACLGLDDRRCLWPRGKALGGTTSINHMIYARGNKLDYDEWARLGNKGWSYDDVLPYFKKSENMRIPELVHSKYHGTGGYLNVENIPYRFPLGEAFLSAGEELGFKRTDPNGADQLGFSHIQSTTRHGTRCSASKAFLRPIRHRSNLHISMETRVSRILIDKATKRVTGVEFYKNRAINRVQVGKEVVLSAGALNSPQILMLSGIGPRGHLESLNIPTLMDLKVGQNLRDHMGFFGINVLVNDSVGLVDVRIMSPESLLKVLPEFLYQGRGPLTSPIGVESIAFIRTKHAVDECPDLELMMVSSSVLSIGRSNLMARREINLNESLYQEVFANYSGRDSFMIVPIVMNTRSRGEIKLKDKNPLHWPKFFGNYLSDPHDVKILLEGIKISLRLINTAAFQKFGSKLHTVPLPGCRKFDFGTDDYWVCAARYLTAVTHHQTGTCKMGPDAHPDAVVDPQARVRGVAGLRVADASIMPTLPAAHPSAVCYMIGEKVADMVKAVW